MIRKTEVSATAREGTPALRMRLFESRGFRDKGKMDAARRELAFHVAEIVVDVQEFLDNRNIGEGWRRLCSQIEIHWPYHEKRARSLLRRISRRGLRGKGRNEF
ncbi:MAG: hypothetical protein JNJ54_25890 [Myxococcaceae bacterium]|nr:hypothetical protein [Myxococcaceae bacterium]